jgi:hypothetical protein
MSRAEDIWNQLNQVIKIDVEINEGPYATTRTTPNLQGDRDDYQGNQDQFIDFPYVEDPEDFQTYKAMEQDESELSEQAPAEEKVPPEAAEIPEEAPPEGGEEIDVTTNVGEEMPGMGMDEPKQELTSSEIGKVYELKKIYSRLISIEAHLSSTTDTSLLQMRSIVAKAMELFETVIVNFEQYKEQIDEIIVTFYKFLELTYGLLQSYYKNDSKNEY